jgi:hypothetical protein
MTKPVADIAVGSASNTARPTVDEGASGTARVTAAELSSAAETAPFSAAETAPRLTLRAWMRDHDDQWPFVVMYLGASVLLSILISLFWLLIVIGVHFIFEYVRQSHYRVGRTDVLLHALWEVKLDIGLAALAFAVALYIDVILGVVGLQAAGRVAVAARFGARAAAWERNLRTFLLTVDEITRVSHAAYILGARRRRRLRAGTLTTQNLATDSKPELPATPSQAVAVPAWQRQWGWGDRIGIVLVSSGVTLILLAPVLTPHDIASSVALIVDQLRPFP